MAQIKVFGVREQLNPMKEQLASVIHSVLMDVLGLPENKNSNVTSPWMWKTSSIRQTDQQHTPLLKSACSKDDLWKQRKI
ncbi:hypothetical protein [Paenibacillus sp. FSL K6-2862]|uniref:hypothetical protein n=1 Tax=Paenibacillus sp. FSL K6-2862 TaxID=2921484 RepID=UPI0030F7C3AB